MLSEIEPSVFEEFMALELLEPSNPWDHTGTIAAAVHNSSGFAEKPRKPDDYIPRPVFGERDADPDRVEAMFRARYGSK